MQRLAFLCLSCRGTARRTGTACICSQPGGKEDWSLDTPLRSAGPPSAPGTRETNIHQPPFFFFFFLMRSFEQKGTGDVHRITEKLKAAWRFKSETFRRLWCDQNWAPCDGNPTPWEHLPYSEARWWQHHELYGGKCVCEKIRCKARQTTKERGIHAAVISIQKCSVYFLEGSPYCVGEQSGTGEGSEPNWDHDTDFFWTDKMFCLLVGGKWEIFL